MNKNLITFYFISSHVICNFRCINFNRSPVVSEPLGKKQLEIILQCIHYVTTYFVTYCTRSINDLFTEFNETKEFLYRDKNENIKYRQKSPERTTSISVTLKLLNCVWCSTGKK